MLLINTDKSPPGSFDSLTCDELAIISLNNTFRSLVKLNLSYNQIRDISGFTEMGSAEHRLSQLELHGNRLQFQNHVTQCLSSCMNLRSLALTQAGADNPLCHTPGKA